MNNDNYNRRNANSGGNRPAGSRPAGNARGAESRPAGSRPAGNTRGAGSRPAGSRPAGNARGAGNRPAGSRPAGNARGAGNRPAGSRPAGNVRGAGSNRQGNNRRPPIPSEKNAFRRTPATSPEYEEEKLPITVYLGIGVTVLAIIILIVSIIADSQKRKNRSYNYDIDSESSQVAASDSYDDDFSEDIADDFDDDVSSQKEYKSFLGTWYKADVPNTERAEFLVSMQYADSFEFKLQIWSGKNSKTLSNTAFYTDETHAEYSPKKNTKIIFERTEEGVTITHKGSNSALGFADKYKIDGKFTEIEPENPTEEITGSYDYNLYKSDAILKALKETLSDDDYALYQDMMENGLLSPIDYERTTDKNGNPVNVDEELNAVKYYAHLNSREYDMIFICSENANIYLLFYNSDEVIYCTNDSNYYKKMPASFQAVADSKGVKPIFR